MPMWHRLKKRRIKAMRKRLLAIIASLSLAVAFAVPAFAAKGISAEEQKLLNKFKAGVTLSDGTVVKPPASYITQAENGLMNDDLTAHDIKVLSDVIDSVYAKIKAEDLHSISEIRHSEKYDSIVKEIQAACKEVGYVVAPTVSGGGDVGNGALIKPIDGSDKETEIDAKPLKPNQTGFDMTATVVSVIALVAVLSGSAVVIGKKNLFAE